MRKPLDILYIGDSHAEHGVPNDRYRWAARAAAELGVHAVVEAGDWWDMPSISDYDRGTAAKEGLRLDDDLDAGIEACEIFSETLEKAGVKPRKYRTRGNHEERLFKYANANPPLQGSRRLGANLFRDRDFGWKALPFLDVLELGGVAFSHYFISGVMGRPIGGENAAASLVKKNFRSSVAGHSHLFDVWTTTDVLGRRVTGLVGGCFFEHDHSFAGQANRKYSRGLVVLRNVRDGEFEHEWISMETVKKRWGKS